MDNTTQMRPLGSSMASLGTAHANAFQGLDWLEIDADFTRLQQHIAELDQRNRELAAELESLRLERAQAQDERLAAESRELACYKLIEDIVTHFHKRDRRVSDAIRADNDYTGLLSRAMVIEQARLKGVCIES